MRRGTRLEDDDLGAVQLIDAQGTRDLLRVLCGDTAAGQDRESIARMGDQGAKVLVVVLDGRVGRTAMRENVVDPELRQRIDRGELLGLIERIERCLLYTSDAADE